MMTIMLSRLQSLLQTSFKMTQRIKRVTFRQGLHIKKILGPRKNSMRRSLRRRLKRSLKKSMKRNMMRMRTIRISHLVKTHSILMAGETDNKHPSYKSMEVLPLLKPISHMG